MAASSQAGIISAAGIIALLMTAVAGLITAFAARRTSRRVEVKVDNGNKQIAEVHVIVNQQRTDMQTVIINQQRQLMALEAAMASAGLAIPVTSESTGEPIVATAIITHEDEAPA